MENLSNQIKNELMANGAVLTGFGNLTLLPQDVRRNMPIGISVAVKYPNNVIRGIAELPTQEYCDWYNKLNEQLDNMVLLGAEILHKHGYDAVAMTRAEVGTGEDSNNTVLPHKTVARLAGIGWIGKSALLVTEQYGSMIRISSILTNAPLKTASPVDKPKCGDCMICATVCPAGAISGKNWELVLYRDEFFVPVKCRKTARYRSISGLCGKSKNVWP